MAAFVYILSSATGTLYTGVTNDLMRRVYEHKKGKGSAFTKRYRVDRLIYFEEGQYITDAIAREKEIKGWKRARKLALVRELNPKFEDLAADWFEDV